MKIICFIISFSFLFLGCTSGKVETELEYQNDKHFNTLGVGLVGIVDTSKKIVLFQDSDCQNLITMNGKLGEDILPLFYKPDYGIQYFICAEKLTKTYKLCSEASNFVYVKTNENLKFYSWSNFFKNRVIGFEPRTNEFAYEYKNRKKLNAAKWNSDDEIKVIKVEGDWLFVENITQKNTTFWLKWQSNGKLILDVFLLM